MIYILLVTIIVCLWKVQKNIIERIDLMEDLAIRRHVLLEDWLFKSLYSINHKVLLPEEKEKPITTKKAKVHSPTEDGMSEFDGSRTDFLQEEL